MTFVNHCGEPRFISTSVVLVFLTSFCCPEVCYFGRFSHGLTDPVVFRVGYK